MSIEEISKGRYKVRYRIGKKQYSKSGFTTKRQAVAFEAEQRRRFQENAWTDPGAGRVTIGVLFHEWLAAKQISDRTRSDYAEVWASVISHKWDEVEVRSVSPADIASWISGLSEKYSVARVAKAFSILSQVFDWAIADNRIPHNPAKRARVLNRGPLLSQRRRINEVRYLTHLEVRRLVGCAGEDGLMLLVMAYTGLRFGEVTALQVQDVDLKSNRLRVTRAYTDIRGKLAITPPKSGKAREVPIPEHVIPNLSQLIAFRHDQDALVFTSKAGKAIRYSRWRREIFNPAVKIAELDGLTPHGLRHTYAVLAIQSGANPKILQSAMGHSDIRLTLDTYGGFFADDLDNLAASISQAFKEAVPENVPNVFPLQRAHRGSSLKKASNFLITNESRLGDLNPGPTHYECVALPLS